MNTASLYFIPKPRPAIGWLGVAMALSAPLIGYLLRPALESAFRFPVDRFMSLWAMWGAVAIALGLSHFCEGIPLSRFGLGRSDKSLRARLLEMIGAVLLAVVLMAIILPFSNYARVALTGKATVLPIKTIPPFWVMAPAWLTAAVAEEILFRSYPIERLEMLTGNRRLGALVTLLGFTVLHLGGWDWIHVLTVALPFGTALTLLYLWRRSLLFVVVIHAMADMPLLFLPLLAPYL